MDKFNVLSLNARGLNSPPKRFSVLDLLQRKNIHFAFIQETHLLETDTHRFSNKHYNVVASSCYTKKSKGVLIAIKRNLSFINLGPGGSDDGRISYCKISCNGMKIALVCVYAPNNFDENFFTSLNCMLFDLSDFQLLIGGDFNAAWLHEIDRTGGREGNFSYFSARHKTFSRIDYIFISKPLFEEICCSEMIPFPLSDHRAVFCSLQIKTGHPRASCWRFNTSLLQNEAFKQKLKQELDFFYQYK
uniref:exodeoxyribonuclease III n=1 Tax=Salarias fasciatus TaxID=181472 RepID=A0A672FVW4_SALFA